MPTKKSQTTPKMETNGDSCGEPKDGELPTFILPRSIVGFLESDEPDGTDEKIPSDHEYFNAILAVETCRALAFYLGEQNRQQYFKMNTETLSKRKTLGESMDELLQKLDTKRQAILERMEENDRTPLLEKFLDALNANTDEKKIFRFVLSLGMMPPDYFDQPECTVIRDPIMGTYANHNATMGGSEMSSPVVIGQILSIPLPFIMQLMNSDSIWVKEQLYYNNSQGHSPMGISITMGSTGGSFGMGHVLRGFEVTLNQYNDVKSSVLQQVLLDHPPFRESEVGKKILKRNAVNSKPLPENLVEHTNVLANALKGGEANGGNASGTRGKRDRLFDALAISMKAEKTNFNQPRNGNDCKLPAADSVEEDTAVQKEEECGKKDTDTTKPDDDEFGPYTSDLAYLEDQVRANILKRKIVQSKVKLDLGDDVLDDIRDPRDGMSDLDYLNSLNPRSGKIDENERFQQEKKLQKIEERLDQLEVKINAKIQASASENGKVFRLEQLCGALQLGAFEKSCVLLLLQDVIIPNQNSGRRSYSNGNMATSVGVLISSFCVSLEDKMKARSFFYKTSTLIEEGILTLFNDNFTSDLSECQVKLDRRLFDFLIGLDTEMSELVNGSHLYKPDIAVDDVILPEQTKKRVLASVLSFDKVKDVIHETGMDEKISYGLGQVLLFYGASGTGKTMLANAIASKLGVKILLINFPDFGTNSSGAIIKFLFREARINKALLFFDECESLFMSREKKGGTGSINMILTELERFDGICILATNRAYDLDEAMHRRISLSIEFQKPDHIMREQLWKAIKPAKLPVDENINYSLLGRKYELVGGTVKNAWLQAISIMIQRSGTTISMADLEQAASEQVRNQLTSEEFDRRIVPTNGIDTMVLDASVKEALDSIVQYSKAQSVLFGQWGFDKIHRSTSGISVLFHGVSGTGKTMAAETIGFDLGRPLLVVNVAELVSKWVGETGKNITQIFSTAKAKDAILVFDEAEGLFGSRKSNGGSTSRHDNLNVGLLLQYIESFAGICVVITNMKESLDEAFFRRFRFVLEFKMPSVEEREKIWKVTLPEQCPIANDVDFGELARRYELSGGGVKNSLLRAATMAALRDGGKNILTMGDLKAACEAEEGKTGNKSASVMGMYN